MKRQMAHWPGSGPCLFSYNYGPGPYRVEFTRRVDTRWPPWVCLGPRPYFWDVEAGIVGSVGQIRALAQSTPGMNGSSNTYIYAAGGSALAKLTLDVTLDVNPSGYTLPDTCTQLLYTKSGNGTEEISIFYDGSAAYDVITAVATAPSSDTVSTAPSHAWRCANYGPSDAGVSSILAAGSGTGSITNLMAQNTLSGSVTMASPNWVTRATIPGENITPTAINLDADSPILETSNGPYYLNIQYSEFRPLFPELPNTRQNSESGAGKWSPLGVISPVMDGTRLIVGGESRSIGTSSFPGNYSQVRGQCVATASDAHWLYWNDFNNTTGYTWTCAVRPTLPQDGHNWPVSFFTLFNSESFYGLGGGAGFSDTEAMSCLLVTRPNDALSPPQAGEPHESGYLVGGVGDGAFWIRLALNTAPWYSQDNLTDTPTAATYQYASSGDWYGEMCCANQEWEKVVDYVEIETANCTANRTVTVYLQMEQAPSPGGASVVVGIGAFGTGEYDAGDVASVEYQQIGYTIKSDGIHRLEVFAGQEYRGVIVKPKVSMATNSRGASPFWRDLKVFYREEPRRQDGNYRRI